MRIFISLTFYLCFCCFTLCAQKSQIGLYINPNSANTKIHGDYHQHFYTLKEGPRFGFDAGIFYKYSFTERLKVELRAGYSLKGFTFLELTDGTNQSLIYPLKSLKSTYQYLEIPIIINYSIIKKSWFDFYPAVGFSFNHLIGTPNDVLYVIQKNITGVQLAAGFAFYPGKKIAINIEPTWKTFLSPVALNNDTTPISRTLSSFGLNIAIGVRF